MGQKKIKFKNITISGFSGSGSSTLGRLLAKELGWEYFSGGDFMRQYAIEKGLLDPRNPMHHSATIYSDEFDRETDYKMRSWLINREHLIIDSWLAGFLAQKIGGVFKVLLFCSKDEIRVDRIVNRDGIEVETAKKHIFERERANIAKWTRMYQQEWLNWVGKMPIDFYQPRLYDLAIDTYSNSKEQVLNQVLEALC